MRNIKYSALFILFIAVLSITGCKKDDDDTPAAPTKTDLLTAKAWKLSTISAPPLQDNDPILLDVIGSLSESDIKFNSDGSYTATNRSTNVVETGTWKFNETETQLITDEGQPETFTFTIIALTENNLEMSTPYSANIGIPITLTVSLKLIPA